MSLGFFGTSSVLLSKRALAINYLEFKPVIEPNPIQRELLENPKKDILLAEVAQCIGIPIGTPQKTKCLNM